MLYVVLQFLGQLRTGGIALCQNNGCLDNLSTDGIRCSGDGTLNDCRMLDEGTFYLERADAVAGALDNIVIASYEPIVAVLVTFEHIVGAVAAAAQNLLCHFGVLVVSHKQTGGPCFFQVLHYQRTVFAVRSRCAVVL